MIDICVVTYNRLEYLKHCIWSIIASTSVEYRLIVISDHSTDGTNEWLAEMKEKGKIDEVLINEKNLGTAQSFNRVIGFSDSEWFAMTCDDIYFYKGWDTAAIGLTKEFDDCGISVFYDSIINDRGGLVRINDHSYSIPATGMGGVMIHKELFERVKGFYLPGDYKMGFIARGFCLKAFKTSLKRNRQYVTVPPYAVQMNRCKLSLEYLYDEYNEMRGREKGKFRKTGL